MKRGPTASRGRDLIPIYSGFDAREEVGFHAFVSSVLHNTSAQVSFTPLGGPQRDGTNAFTYARFTVPALQGRKGFAIFADGCDMVCKADIADLWALRDLTKAVQVVPHDYRTKHARKYVGTKMEAANADYPCKNWSSLMLINCGHDAWSRLIDIDTLPGSALHRFEFMERGEIGYLPAEWNWLADEYGENKAAKLLHWTAGIPGWPAYHAAPHASDWWAARDKVNHASD